MLTPLQVLFSAVYYRNTLSVMTKEERLEFWADAFNVETAMTICKPLSFAVDVVEFFRNDTWRVMYGIMFAIAAEFMYTALDHWKTDSLGNTSLAVQDSSIKQGLYNAIREVVSHFPDRPKFDRIRPRDYAP
jgi:hypothetical protein